MKRYRVVVLRSCYDRAIVEANSKKEVREMIKEDETLINWDDLETLGVDKIVRIDEEETE